MKKNTSFSLQARGKSFKYAIEGATTFLRSEHNTVIHLSATILVIVMGLITHVSKSEIILLALAIGFVWTAELFNTAIEKTLDFVSLKQDLKIKFIKDISAAAVLVAAIVALITGFIIFIPKL